MDKPTQDLQENIEPEAEEDSLRSKYLTFIISKETYGIEIRYVTEIVSIEEITAMPEMPNYIKGIINLRGRIIPVIDVRLRFGKQERQYDDRTCIIVMNYYEHMTGLIVDSVSEVLTIPETNIVELSKINTVNSNSCINNVGKCSNNVILLINCSALIELESDSINIEGSAS